MKNLTAKNIKKFQTDDGYAWSASFYLNGKKIGTASNGGFGGPTNTTGIDDKALAEILAFADVTPPHNDYDFERAESLLESVVWDTLDQRDSKRKLKAKVIAKLPDGVFTWRTPKGKMAEVKALVLKKYPTAIIVNDLPFDEAHKILTTPTN